MKLLQNAFVRGMRRRNRELAREKGRYSSNNQGQLAARLHHQTGKIPSINKSLIPSIPLPTTNAMEKCLSNRGNLLYNSPTSILQTRLHALETAFREGKRPRFMYLPSGF